MEIFVKIKMGELSDSIKMNSGLRQRGPMSFVLFNLILEL